MVFMVYVNVYAPRWRNDLPCANRTTGPLHLQETPKDPALVRICPGKKISSSNNIWNALATHLHSLYIQNLYVYIQNLYLYIQNLSLYIQNLYLYIQNLSLYIQNLYLYIQNHYLYIQNLSLFIKNLSLYIQNLSLYIQNFMSISRTFNTLLLM